MHFAKALLVSAAFAATFGAQAVVTGSVAPGLTGPLISLTAESFGQPCVTPAAGNNCALGPLAAPVATISGGTIYATDMQFADDVLPGVPFLATGPTSTSPSLMTFVGGTSYLGLLWGSPDTYNLLTLRDNNNVAYEFTTASLGFSVQDGNQSFNQYVQFFASAGTVISTATFSSGLDAFETTQFSITPVPEPETYALMLAGLAALGVVSRRRKRA